MSPGQAKQARIALERVLEREGLGWLAREAAATAPTDEHQHLLTLIDTTLAALPETPAGGPGRDHVAGLSAALRHLRDLCVQHRFERRTT